MDFDKYTPICPDCNKNRLQQETDEETKLICSVCGHNYFYYKGELISTRTGNDRKEEANNSHSTKRQQEIEIKRHDCVLCRACLITCPHNAIIEDVDKRELYVREKLCTLCGRCIEVCNYEAIAYKTKEL